MPPGAQLTATTGTAELPSPKLAVDGRRVASYDEHAVPAGIPADPSRSAKRPARGVLAYMDLLTLSLKPTTAQSPASCHAITRLAVVLTAHVTSKGVAQHRVTSPHRRLRFGADLAVRGEMAG